MNNIKPREVIYFEFSPILTDMGEVFMCFALDHASQFCFDLGVEEELSDQTILQKVGELLENENFKKHDCAFELVMYRHPHLQDQINTLLSPAKGKVTFNEERFYHATHEFITAMYNGILKRVENR